MLLGSGLPVNFRLVPLSQCAVHVCIPLSKNVQFFDLSRLSLCRQIFSRILHMNRIMQTFNRIGGYGCECILCAREICLT